MRIPSCLYCSALWTAGVVFLTSPLLIKKTAGALFLTSPVINKNKFWPASSFKQVLIRPAPLNKFIRPALLEVVNCNSVPRVLQDRCSWKGNLTKSVFNAGRLPKRMFPHCPARRLLSCQCWAAVPVTPYPTMPTHCPLQAGSGPGIWTCCSAMMLQTTAFGWNIGTWWNNGKGAQECIWVQGETWVYGYKMRNRYKMKHMYMGTRWNMGT